MSKATKSEPVRSKFARTNIGKKGRLVIPANLRRSIGLKDGDAIIVREEGTRLVIEKPEAVHQRLKSRLAHLPKERSIVDEFIAERREAAKKELEE